MTLTGWGSEMSDCPNREHGLQLHPAETMALTVARAQVRRGENPPLNTTAMLVMALDRLTGHKDWTKGVRDGD